MQAALAHPAKSAREREYVAALSDFYKPGPRDYQARVGRTPAAMASSSELPQRYGCGRVLRAVALGVAAPDDDSLTLNRNAMAVLTPLFAQFPIIRRGALHHSRLAIPRRWPRTDLRQPSTTAKLSASAPHAVHMPGHIFARLGMWQADIDANVGSVAASHAAESRKQTGAMDQFHRTISWCTPTCRAVKRLGPKPYLTIPPLRFRTSRPCRTWASTT